MIVHYEVREDGDPWKRIEAYASPVDVGGVPEVTGPVEVVLFHKRTCLALRVPAAAVVVEPETGALLLRLDPAS